MTVRAAGTTFKNRQERLQFLQQFKPEDLFYQCIPDIAEITVDLRKRTPEQQEQFKSECLEYASSLSKFAYDFIRKVLIVIDKYLKKDEGARMMKIDDIKIYPCFAAHEPKPEKMQRKEQYFEETGALQSQIILDSRRRILRDGENQMKDGRYGYQYMDGRGKRCAVYSWKLVETDRTPSGKRDDISTITSGILFVPGSVKTKPI